jgi:hypothetical protein
VDLGQAIGQRRGGFAQQRRQHLPEHSQALRGAEFIRPGGASRGAQARSAGSNWSRACTRSRGLSMPCRCSRATPRAMKSPMLRLRPMLGVLAPQGRAAWRRKPCR